MSEIRFSDGISFKTTGPYRIESRADGLYIVGNGFLCAVSSEEEGQTIIDELTGKKKGGAS